MKKIVKAFLVLFVLFTGGVGPASAQTADTEHIESLLNLRDYDTALALIEESAKKDKKNETLDMQKGFVLIQLQKYKAATKFYKELIKKWRANPVPMNNLAIIYRLQENYDDAIKVFENTIKKFPDSSLAHENLGDTYLKRAEAAYLVGLKSTENNEMLSIKYHLSRDFHALSTRSIAAIRAQRSAEIVAQKQIAAAQTSNQAGADLSSNGQIMERLRLWVASRARKDPENYFSHYSGDFTPANGSTTAVWKEYKRALLADSTDIQITLNDIAIQLRTPGDAIATFSEDFSSNLRKEVVRKQIDLKKRGETWWIVRETELN